MQLDPHEANRRYWLDERQSRETNERHSGDDWHEHPAAAAFTSEVSGRLQSGMRIAEIGCASGFWYKQLDCAGLGVDYTGFDLSPLSIDDAREKFPGATFHIADLTMIERLDAFDYIIARQVLFFLDRPSVERILAQIRPGALLTLQEPHRDTVKISKSEKGAVFYFHAYANLAKAAGLTILTERLVEYDKPNGKRMRKILLTCGRYA